MEDETANQIAAELQAIRETLQLQNELIERLMTQLEDQLERR